MQPEPRPPVRPGGFYSPSVINVVHSRVKTRTNNGPIDGVRIRWDEYSILNKPCSSRNVKLSWRKCCLIERRCRDCPLTDSRSSLELSMIIHVNVQTVNNRHGEPCARHLAPNQKQTVNPRDFAPVIDSYDPNQWRARSQHEFDFCASVKVGRMISYRRANFSTHKFKLDDVAGPSNVVECEGRAA